MGSVVIAGAGIFGVTAALELRRRGHAVAIMDPGPLPRPEAASTDVSKIVRLDYGADEAATALMERALLGWRGWNRRWAGGGLAPLYHEDGLLVLTRRPMAPGGFEHESWQVLLRRGHRPQRLDSAALAARHPEWNAALYVDGYFNPEGGWAESGAVLARLIDEARAAGVALHEGHRFVRLLERYGRVEGLVTASVVPAGEGTGRETDAAEHRAEHTIVAAGAWTPVLLPWLAAELSVVGQPVLLFRPEDPQRLRPPRFPPWTADVSRTGFYGFPALADGTLKIGHHGAGRRVQPDAPRIVGPEEEARFRAFLAETFPSLRAAPLAGSRLCLYCDTADANFWIDHDPERPGLLVAAGGSGHAFKFAPVLGELVADALERRDDPATAPWRRRCAWHRRSRGGAAEGPRIPGGADQARAGRLPSAELRP